MRSLLLLALLPAVASAQLSAITPGTRLRLDAMGMPNRLVGTLAKPVADSTLWVRSARDYGAAVNRGDSLYIPILTIRRIEVSRGRSRSKGAQIGATIGVLGGLTAGALASMSASKTEGGPAEAVVGIAVGGLVGAACTAIGALAGSERWERLPPHAVRP